MRFLLRNAFYTPDGTLMESHSRHDYREYTDANGKTYMIDGGIDYVRRSNHGDEVCACVWTDDDFETVRQATTWGTRGKYGDEPLRYVPVAEMTNKHIQAVLDTQPMMSAVIKGVMIMERDYRIQNNIEITD